MVPVTMDAALRPEDWSRHSAALRRLARRLVAGPDQAEDLVQSAYLAALERPPRRLTLAWLARVVRSRAVDRSRRAARWEGSATPPEPTEDLDAAGIAQRLELYGLLSAAVRELPEPLRRAVYLRYFEDRSPTEIAAALDLPVKTVKTRLYRATERLRETLERRWGSDGWHAALVALGASSPTVPVAMAAAGGALVMMKKVALGAVVALGLFGLVRLGTGGGDPARPGDPAASPEPEAPSLATPEGPEDETPLTDLAAAAEREELEMSTPVEPAAPAARAGTGSLRVRVFWDDGQPAAGVAIGLRVPRVGQATDPRDRVVSDAEGVARASDLPAGSVELESDRGGRVKAEVVAGTETEVRFDLGAGIDVQGVVLDGKERPVAGAGVWLTTGRGDWLGGRVVTEAGADGRFRVRDVPEGQSLGALAEGYAPSALVDLDVLDVTQQPVEIRLLLTRPGGGLVVQVLDAEGRGAEGAQVCLGGPSFHSMRLGGTSEESWSHRLERTDAAGVATFVGLEPGEVPMAVRWPGAPVWRGSIEVPDQGRAQHEVQLAAAVSVSGTVRGEDGEPKPGAVVRAFDTPISRGFLQMGQFDYHSPFGYASTEADAEGRYELLGLQPGRVELFASPPRKRGEGMRSFPWAQTSLEIPPGESAVWDARVAPGPTIAGTVTFADGQPMKQVFVHAEEEGVDEPAREAVVTDPEGRYRFYQMHGARYRVWVQVWNAPAGSAPLARDHVQPDAGPVDFVADFTGTGDLAKSVVRGTLDDAGGRVSLGNLRLLLENDRQWWRIHFEREGLDFHFPDLEPGRYKLLVLSGEALVHAGPWFDLGPGEDRDLGTIVTEPAAAVRLHLIRPPGQEDLTATAFLGTPGTFYSREVKFETSSEVLLEGLTPGDYELTLYARDHASPRVLFTASADEIRDVEIHLEPGAKRDFRIVLPEDVELTLLEVEATDDQGHRWLHHSTPKVPPTGEPFVTGGRFVPGSYTLAVRVFGDDPDEPAYATEHTFAIDDPTSEAEAIVIEVD